MRRISILCLAVVWQANALRAQLATVNEMGLSWGHIHLYPPDRNKEENAWLALGGHLLNNILGNIPIGFPGIIILIAGPRQTSVGSEGSLVDHLAFRVPDLQASTTKWKGIKTWWNDSNWGLKVESGSRPGQAFVTTPGGVRVEILEDKSLKVPMVFDHAHFVVEESRLKEMVDYYAKMFGAKPAKGEADTLSMPGGKLVFTKSATPTATTVGRTLDHIGFNMLNAEALAAYSKAAQAKGAKFTRPPESTSMGMTRVDDGFGTVIEVTKAQGGYFDAKLLDKTFYEVDGTGRKQGDPRPQR